MVTGLPSGSPNLSMSAPSLSPVCSSEDGGRAVSPLPARLGGGQPVGSPRLTPGRVRQQWPPQPPPAAPGRRRPRPQSFSRRRAQCRLLSGGGGRGRRRRPVSSLSPAQRHGHGGPGFNALPLLRLGRAESLLLPQHGKFLQSLGKCKH
jgi:hypothetical protein